MTLVRIALVGLFAIGCSNHTGSGDDGPPVDASATAVQLACESGSATFPPLEKACDDAADCFIALHMKDCCGTYVAIGLNKTAQTSFTEKEAVCNAGFPACGCAAGPTAAEDGRNESAGTIEVSCTSNVCKTYVP